MQLGRRFSLFSFLFAAATFPIVTETASAVPSGFVDEVASSGWNQPVGFTHDADGRQYVWEKNGKVWIVENGNRLPSPLIDLSAEVGNWRDFGMLGFALDPDFLQNGHIYLYYVVDRHHLIHFGTSSYNAATNEYFAATVGRVTRYTANSADGFQSVDLSSRKVLLGETKSTGVPILHQSHGTGAMLFGTDGTLILSSGDGASYSSTDVGSASETYYQQALTDGIIRPEENVGAFRSQMLGSLNGKIIRIDPNTGDGIPSNPYFDSTAPRSPKSRTFALGLRNPSRIALRPGSGSPDPSTGNPGAITIGDVGWGTREEVDIADVPGKNFGWPLFEGHDAHPGYTAALTENKDVQNPMWGTPGCTEQFLNFQDLIKQAQEDHNPSFPNRCDPATQLPASVPKWMHARPSIDYRRNVDSVRVGTYTSSGAHSTADVGASGSPTTGDQFRGNCAIGGVWHSGVGFPASYGPSYYHADYGQGRIVRIQYDSENNPDHVQLFHTNASIVFVGTEPADNSLHYINIATNQIRRIRYTGNSNLAPTARFTASTNYGPGPLTVAFDGSTSSDPENGTLVFDWSFGDGTTAIGATPTHTFSNATGNPEAFQVSLTVTDPGNESHTVSLPVSINNTPPAVEITGFQNGARYDQDASSNIALNASVTDAEHAQNTLDYEWQTYLHHGNHNHPEPISTSQSLTAVITPTPKSSEFYAYRVRLTVTDPLGLSAEANSWLYPERDPALPVANITVPTNNTTIAPGDVVNVTAQPTGAVDRVEFYANGTPVGSDNTAPYTTSFTPSGTGGVSVVTLAVSGFSSTVSDAVLVNVEEPGAGLSTPWSAADIGNVDAAGSATFAGGTFTVKGSGRDIWDTTDEFHFVSQPLTGDGEIVAQISSLSNVHPWAKAGLMLRSSPGVGAPYAAMLLTPERGAVFQYRTGTNATTTGRRNPSAHAPRWVRIKRTGTMVAGYHSTDGVNWTTTWFQDLNLPQTVFAGMCLTSHEDGTLGTATFKNVTITGFNGTPQNNPPTVALTSPQNGASFSNTATVSLAANASDTDGSVASVAFYSGGAQIASDSTAPYSVDTVFPVAGTYQLSAVATDNEGATTTSAVHTITVTEDQTGGGLPSGWAGGDIGTGQQGSSSFSAGVYTVTGSGADIWGSSDGFHFARRTLSGDGEIIARVLSVEDTDEWAKAGVMIRDGAGTSSPYAAMLMTPVGRAAFQYRLTAGANAKGSAQQTFTFPHWVRLVRIGNTFTGYRSSNGSNWTQVSSAVVDMPATVFVGLAVTSHNTAVTNQSVFDSVIISGGTGGNNDAPTVALTSPQDGAQFTTSETVNIAADASDGDGTVASVKFFSGSTLIGEDATAPYTASAVFPVAGTYPITAVATDNLGATANSTSRTITITQSGGGTTPPAPWQLQDVGNVGIAGSSSFDNGIYTQQGSGSDIWGTRDQFHYLHQTLSGDGEIVAKLSAFSANHAWAKAGVMIRSSLADNAPFGSMLITPGSNGNGGGFIYRTATAVHTKMVRHPLATAPRWVRVKRAGDQIIAYHSADGTNWVTVGNITIPMGQSAYIGLATTSHDNLETGTAAFENVTVTP